MKEFLLITVVGALGIWKSIPLGFIMKLDPFEIAVATILGASMAAFLLFMMASRVKAYAVKRMHKERMQKRSRRLRRIFDKYGALGVGFLGTLIIGPNLSIVLGLTIVSAEKRLLLATLAGIIIWSAVLTLLGQAGMESFRLIKGT